MSASRTKLASRSHALRFLACAVNEDLTAPGARSLVSEKLSVTSSSSSEEEVEEEVVEEGGGGGGEGGVICKRMKRK